MMHSQMRVADAAYRTLRDYSDGTFPISPIQIARAMGIGVIDLADIEELIDYIDPDGELRQTPAFYFSYGGRHFIALDRSRGDVTMRRAWLAHELGHIVLGSDLGDDDQVVHTMISGTFRRSLVELSCDMFALYLLAPQAVLSMGGVTSSTDVSRICRVHPTVGYIIAGAIRLRRDEFREIELAVWDKMGYGLQARILQVNRCPHYARPLWAGSDISDELTY